MPKAMVGEDAERRTEAKAMTPEAQRITIAAACGWKAFPPTEPSDGNWLSPAPLGEFHESPPDYLNDLNACHEMEKRLTGEQWGNYKAHLIDLVFSNPPTNRGIIHATAAQRAEAFLRTIGKWATP